jgi:hypothetical protein
MTLELLKVEFRVIGLRRDDDDDGTPVEEIELAQGACYAKALDALPGGVRKVVEEAAAKDGQT